MKVNKRNIIELILQILIIPILFDPHFLYASWNRYYYTSSYFSRYSCLEYIEYTFESCFEDAGFVFSLMFLALAVCSVVLLWVQLLGKNRNLLIAPVLIAAQAFFLLIAIIMWVTESLWTVCEFQFGVFFIILALYVILSVISVWGYIKAKKHGITDEPLARAKEKLVVGVETTAEATPIVYGEAYFNLALHVFLSVITFGVWTYIWTYKTTKFLNKTANAEVYSPTKKLLLCIFVPMYQTYWYFKHGEKVDSFSQHKGLKNSYLTILCPLIPVPIVSSVIMQDKINQLCMKK